jgi:hypothetical protein
MINFAMNIADDHKAYLQRCACIRQTSLQNLCRRIIEVIARDQMVLAILDDQSQPIDGRRYHYRRGDPVLFNWYDDEAGQV